MASNFAKWQLFMGNCTSPQIWIDFGFYFMIGAALQRRVWLYGDGEDGSELFPNPYIVFVGRPGLGKGLITRPVARLLKHHKMDIGNLIKTNIGSEKRPIFPSGPDSVTFEQLLDVMADAIRPIMRPGIPKPYVHSSVYFVLEELDSLFKRKTIDVTTFLKNAYDCGSYSYETRHEAKHQLRNLCLSLLAGTQPDFFRDAQKQGLFGEGFASRTLFLFANEKRFSKFHNTELSPEQKEAEAGLLAWIKRLSTLYGRVTYDAATHEMLESWDKAHTRKELEVHGHMQEYMSRKKVNMLKLAMAIHFGENTSFEIPITCFEKADKLLTACEPALAEGLGCAGSNPLFFLHTKIKEYLLVKNGSVTERELIIQFIRDAQPDSIREVLASMLELGQITTRKDKGQTIYETPRTNC